MNIIKEFSQFSTFLLLAVFTISLQQESTAQSNYDTNSSSRGDYRIIEKQYECTATCNCLHDDYTGGNVVETEWTSCVTNKSKLDKDANDMCLDECEGYNKATATDVDCEEADDNDDC
jgi:hypothetical protein